MSGERSHTLIFLCNPIMLMKVICAKRSNVRFTEDFVIVEVDKDDKLLNVFKEDSILYIPYHNVAGVVVSKKEGGK